MEIIFRCVLFGMTTCVTHYVMDRAVPKLKRDQCFRNLNSFICLSLGQNKSQCTVLEKEDRGWGEVEEEKKKRHKEKEEEGEESKKDERTTSKFA